MKKNVMMRVASILLIAVLITTSAISGTYAKYVTQDTGSDAARVAQFGVTVAVEGDSDFSNEYASDTTAVYAGATVKSADDAKVVAPGTASAGGGLTIAINGKPEVATKIDINMTVNHDVYLAAGVYGDPTSAVTTDTFGLTETYRPVVFTLKDSGGNLVAEGDLATVAAAFNAESAAYAPNETLDETYTLTWAWAFDGNDAADTLLGNLAADAAAWDPANEMDYDLNIDYEVTVTVTQIN